MSTSDSDDGDGATEISQRIAEGSPIGGSGDGVQTEAKRLVNSKSQESNLALSDAELETAHINRHHQESNGFDALFLRRFYRIHGLLFLGVNSIPTLLFSLLLCTSLLQEYIGYHTGLIASKYFVVLGEKDLRGFWMQTLVSFGIIVSISFTKSSKQYLQKLLTVTWRQLLCKATHKLYFSNIHCYQLNVLDKVIDNPDQRMTQDIDKFSLIYCDVLPKIICAPFVIGYYTYQSFIRSGWQGPAGCFGFFVIATLMNKMLMGPIVRTVVKQEKREGDFRFIHLLVRVNSESIAFHNASRLEGQKANESLDILVETQHSLYCKQYLLNFATNTWDYLGAIVSYLVLAIPIFAGVYDNITPAELGALISANAFVNIYLIYSFTSLIDISANLSDIAGVTHRIAQLIERINALSEFWRDLFPDENNDDGRSSNVQKYEDWRKRRDDCKNFANPGQCYNTSDADPLLPAWTIVNLSFSPPLRHEPLIKDLTMTISVGESILVVGGSSSGKSSFLRLLRGLWPHSDGTIIRHLPPGPRGVFYCPQAPYLTIGTLREQVCFPLKVRDTCSNEDQSIIDYLTILNLRPLLERMGGLDSPVSWNLYDSLSPGEMQRLCFLRVFYHRPLVAVLDEATSALPLSMEDIVYTECRRLGITTISVGHRASLNKYHEKLLTLDSGSGWILEPIVL